MEQKHAGAALAAPLYFAPMEGVTGWVYRRAHRRYFPGVDKYFMPFLSPAQEHIFTRRMFRDILPACNEGVPAVPQLLTRRAEDFLWAARELHAMGYGEVNLNLGCPSGTVTAKGKGSGFLAMPDELERFLDQVFEKTPVPVSVKTRLGVEDPAEFGPLLALYGRYPIAELTIHARVRKDFYKGPVRLEAFERALAETSLRVCYNGDLETAGDCISFAASHPKVSALMVGRGLVADPALCGKARGGPPADRSTLRAFHDAVYEGYCQDFGSRRNAMMRMKEYWFYHIHLFEDHDRHAKGLKKARTAEEYEAWVGRIFQDLPLRGDALPGWRG